MIWLRIDTNSTTFSIYDGIDVLWYCKKPYDSITDIDGYITIRFDGLSELSIPKDKCIIENIY